MFKVIFVKNDFGVKKTSSLTTKFLDSGLKVSGEDAFRSRKFRKLKITGEGK